ELLKDILDPVHARRIYMNRVRMSTCNVFTRYVKFHPWGIWAIGYVRRASGCLGPPGRQQSGIIGRPRPTLPTRMAKTTTAPMTRKNTQKPSKQRLHGC